MSLPTTKQTLDKARKILGRKDIEIKDLRLKIEYLRAEITDLRGMLGDAHDILDVYCPNHPAIDEISRYFEKGE